MENYNENIETEPKNLKIGDLCPEKFGLLKEFLEKAGMTYGVNGEAD